MGKQKSGWLGLLEKVGVVEFVPSDPEAEEAQQSSSSSPPPASSPVAPRPVVRPSVSTSVEPAKLAGLDASAKATLQMSLDEVHNSYSEFQTTIMTLAETIPSESSLYKTALKLLSAKKIPTQTLLSDVDACIGALEKGNRDFDSTMNSHIENQVGGTRKSVAKLDQSITSKEEQLRTLNAELEALRKQKEKESASINEEEQHVALVRSRFAVIFEAMRNDLRNQRQKIENYGKGS